MDEPSHAQDLCLMTETPAGEILPFLCREKQQQKQYILPFRVETDSHWHQLCANYLSFGYKSIWGYFEWESPK